MGTDSLGGGGGVCPAPTEMPSPAWMVPSARSAPLPTRTGLLAWEEGELAQSRSYSRKNFFQPLPSWWRTHRSGV